MDLRVEWDTIGCRRLWVLVQGLPPDSAFYRQGKLWTQAHELTALAVEKLEHRLSTLAVMWADEKSKGRIPPPIVITHPDRPQPPPKKKSVSPGALMSLFGGGGKK